MTGDRLARGTGDRIAAGTLAGGALAGDCVGGEVLDTVAVLGPRGRLDSGARGRVLQVPGVLVERMSFMILSAWLNSGTVMALALT